MSLKFTIVTPVYNGERFMRQTIESVISQEGDFFIDYIVMDDGSKDTSLEIIKEYAEKIRSASWPIKCKGIEFRYFTGPNEGQTRKYNQAFGMAKGELMAWMNADDYYMPGIFEKIARFYEQRKPVDFIYGDCLKVYEDGNKKSSLEPRPRPDETFESLRTRGNSFDLCFFTKRIFDAVGPLDVDLKYCMDLDFWFRIFKVAKAVYIPETIAAFRLWSGSNTVSKQDGFARERKLLARRYGGTIIPARKIYKLRGKLTFLNSIKTHTPHLYSRCKKVFYYVVDLFTYKPISTDSRDSHNIR